MNILILYKEYDYGGAFGVGEVLGTFSEVSKVNEWCKSNIEKPTCFIDTKRCPSQSIYFNPGFLGEK